MLIDFGEPDFKIGPFRFSSVSDRLDIVPVLIRSVQVKSNQSAWQVWNTETNQLQRTLTVPGGGFSAPTGGTFSRGGDKILIISMSDVVGYGGVTLWNLDSGEAVPGLGEQRKVLSAVFSPDDKVLALGTWDRSVNLWDVGWFRYTHWRVYIR